MLSINSPDDNGEILLKWGAKKKVFLARLLQQGDGNPEARVIENTLDEGFQLTRMSPGFYRMTLPNVVINDPEKLVILFSPPNNWYCHVSISWYSANVIDIATGLSSAASPEVVPQDNVLGGANAQMQTVLCLYLYDD